MFLQGENILVSRHVLLTHSNTIFIRIFVCDRVIDGAGPFFALWYVILLALILTSGSLVQTFYSRLSSVLLKISELSMDAI